jgi:hypothetical protein
LADSIHELGIKARVRWAHDLLVLDRKVARKRIHTVVTGATRLVG